MRESKIDDLSTATGSGRAAIPTIDTNLEPGESAHEHEREERWLEWGRVGFVALVSGLVWLRVIPPAHGIDWVALAGLLIGGYPIFREAIADLLDRRMTMELSMTIALIAAAAIGEFFTALLIAVFVLIAEILEGMTERTLR